MATAVPNDGVVLAFIQSMKRVTSANNPKTGRKDLSEELRPRAMN